MPVLWRYGLSLVAIVAVVVGGLTWFSSPGPVPDRATVGEQVERIMLRDDGERVTATCAEPAEDPDGGFRSTCTLTGPGHRRGWASVSLDGRRGAPERRAGRYHATAGEWSIAVAGSVPVDGTGAVDRTFPSSYAQDAPALAATGTVAHALRALGRDGSPVFRCSADTVPVGGTVSCTASGPVPEAAVDRVDEQTFRVRAQVPPTGR